MSLQKLIQNAFERLSFSQYPTGQKIPGLEIQDLKMMIEGVHKWSQSFQPEMDLDFYLGGLGGTPWIQFFVTTVQLFELEANKTDRFFLTLDKFEYILGETRKKNYDVPENSDYKNIVWKMWKNLNDGIESGIYEVTPHHFEGVSDSDDENQAEKVGGVSDSDDENQAEKVGGYRNRKNRKNRKKRKSRKKRLNKKSKRKSRKTRKYSVF